MPVIRVFAGEGDAFITKPSVSNIDNQLNSLNILRYSERFLSAFLSLIVRAMREMHLLMKPRLETNRSSAPVPAKTAIKIVRGVIVSVEKISQIDSVTATMQRGMNMKPAKMESLRSYLALVSA